MNNIEKTSKKESDELVERLLIIFRKEKPSKEEMLLTAGIAFMAGMEKGKDIRG